MLLFNFRESVSLILECTIATGGAKTVGTALKLTAESFEQLLKLGGRGLKTLGKAPVSLVETLIALFRYLRKLNVQKLLDDLIALIVKLFKTTKQVAEEAFKKIFNPNQRNRIERAGLTPTKVDEFGNVTLCPIKT